MADDDSVETRDGQWIAGSLRLRSSWFDVFHDRLSGKFIGEASQLDRQLSFANASNDRTPARSDSAMGAVPDISSEQRSLQQHASHNELLARRPRAQRGSSFDLRLLPRNNDDIDASSCSLAPKLVDAPETLDHRIRIKEHRTREHIQSTEKGNIVQ
ncbi:hypothetical protein T484DRAFT_1761486, partial [Baffinella frigidus]